jgi:hypothetical protein
MEVFMKVFFVFLIACFFFLAEFSPIHAGIGEAELQLKGQTLSAQLNKTSLRAILEKLRKEKGIWFKCKETLLEEKISVRFKNLSLEEGLNRIFSFMDYSLIFDRNNQLEGILIIGKKSPGSTELKGKAVRNKMPASSKTSRQYGNDNSSGNNLTSKGSVKGDQRGSGNFRVGNNSPLPGGDVNENAKKLENFIVIKNSPPPGGSVNEATQGGSVNKATQGGSVNEDTRDASRFEIKKNILPPGGPVETPAQVLEKFKVIKNSPPSGS